MVSVIDLFHVQLLCDRIIGLWKCIYIYIYMCVCVCVYLHLRCSALRVTRKRIITIKQVFCQPIAELVLLLHVLAEHHSHLQVATNDEDMDSVLCRLSVTNGKMLYMLVSLINIWYC